MRRNDLKAMGLSKEQIEAVMALQGRERKVPVAEPSKTEPQSQPPAKTEDDKSKSGSKAELEALEKKYQDEIAALKVENEIGLFFAGLDRKFVTPETQQVFAAKLKEARKDEKNVKKELKDLFSEIIKDGEGKDRTDIFALDAKTGIPLAVGASGGAPDGAGQKKDPPTIL